MFVSMRYEGGNYCYYKLLKNLKDYHILVKKKQGWSVTMKSHSVPDQGVEGIMAILDNSPRARLPMFFQGIRTNNVSMCCVGGVLLTWGGEIQ